MNFNIFLKNLFSRCIGIIGSPKEEWIKIREENESIFQLITHLLLPLLLLMVFVSMIGSYIQMIGSRFDPAIIVISGLRPFLSISMSIVIGIIAINAMIRTFEGIPNPNLAAKLVVYSFVPVILVAIFLGMAPWFYILGLFSLYSFYIFFIGTPILLDIPTERQSNFSTLSSTTILIIYLLVNIILSSFFGAIQ